MKIRSTFYDSERMNQTALGGLCKTHEYKYMETNIQENKRNLEEQVKQIEEELYEK